MNWWGRAGEGRGGREEGGVHPLLVLLETPPGGGDVSRAEWISVCPGCVSNGGLNVVCVCVSYHGSCLALHV